MLGAGRHPAASEIGLSGAGAGRRLPVPRPLVLEESVLAALSAAVASLVSGVFSVSLLRRYLAGGRRNAALLWWGVALAMFCIASVGLLTGVVGGWTSAEFRTFYLFGGVLNVPWLAVGSIAVNARSELVSRLTGGVLLVVAVVVGRQVLVADEPALWLPAAVLAAAWAVVLLIGRARVVVPGAAAILAVYSAVAAWVVLTADYVVPLAATGLPEGRELFAPAVRGFAVGGNATGAVTVIVSALISSATMVWTRPDRRHDRLLTTGTRRGAPIEALAAWVFRGRTLAPVVHLVRGNLLIALGVGLAAAGGVLSFLGETTGHAMGFTVGVVVMYLGFVRTTRPLPPPAAVAEVVVYTRERCGLCRRAEELVDHEAPGATVRHVDIDADPELQARYGVRVPVVTVDGVEVAELEVAPGTIRDAVARVRRQPR